MSAHHDEPPHLPPPSLWPVGFAVGVVCILVGLVVSWVVAAVGAVIAAVFAFLWIRDLSSQHTPAAPDVEEPAAVDATAARARPTAGEAALAAPSDEEIAAYPRSKFLEGATLAVGGVIGGLITVPALGFAVLPSFVDTEEHEVNLGPLENFPQDKFVITTYLEDPQAGEVSRRTVYVRNNGLLETAPSFTILFSRCVHLGCPVQPSGPTSGDPKKVGQAQLQEVLPAGFGCPCHGGAYDNEGNRTAGPPVRALDRFEFKIKDGELWLGKPYSVASVSGTGASAKIKKYAHMTPGVHVDGPEAWLYPIAVPN